MFASPLVPRAVRGFIRDLGNAAPADEPLETPVQSSAVEPPFVARDRPLVPGVIETLEDEIEQVCFVEGG